jgi:phosphoserine aminotransferase
MARAMNFNAGPAALPLAALERAHSEFFDISGSGMSIMEHSHRGKVYEKVHFEAIALVRELLAVPDNYDVLFLQGGASQQFAMIPMNLLPAGKSADYITTGTWSKKALSEAKLLGKAKVACDVGKDGKFNRIPKQTELTLDPEAAYVHYTTNNTIAGTQWHYIPETGKVPLIADMSSDIMWKPIDVSRFGLIYAGAQKNLGPSGVTLVIVRKDLVAAGREDIPAIFRYKTHAENDSLYNTPPTFGIYLLRNVLAEMKRVGGLMAMQKHNQKKADLLYSAIESRPELYSCPVERDARSVMNVVFNLPSEERENDFLAKAGARGLVGLKGHRSVGGVRASIYNAVQLEWVEALVQFMKEYA